MPLTFSASADTNPFGIILNNCYAVVTDFSAADLITWNVTVAVYASQAAYQGGKQPGWSHAFAVPAPANVLSLVETSVMTSLSAVPGLTGLEQV